MNARDERAELTELADEISVEDEAEFWRWARLVSAGDELERGIARGDPDALRIARSLANLLDATPARDFPVVPAVNRLADGPPPF